MQLVFVKLRNQYSALRCRRVVITSDDNLQPWGSFASPAVEAVANAGTLFFVVLLPWIFVDDHDLNLRSGVDAARFARSRTAAPTVTRVTQNLSCRWDTGMAKPS